MPIRSATPKPSTTEQTELNSRLSVAKHPVKERPNQPIVEHVVLPKTYEEFLRQKEQVIKVGEI